MVTTWWVNQGRSFGRGVDALAKVWAPLTSTSGGVVSSWRQLDDVQAGDILIHYARSAIRGFSVASAAAYERDRPWYEPNDDYGLGKAIPVNFAALAIPVPLMDIPAVVRELPDAGPFDRRGLVKQGYMFPVDDTVASELFTLLAIEPEESVDDDGNPLTLINGETERLGIAKYRVEQPMVRRRRLNGREEAECDLCGDRFPKGFLVAAHIKRRSQTSDDERRDLNNIMLACTFGCDAAFEQGALRVNRQGQVYLSEKVSPVVEKRLSNLVGRSPLCFSEANGKYFRSRERSFN